MTMPLAALIADRLAQLGLNTHALAARLGYVNTNKGSRRLQTRMEGRLDGHLELLSGLAVALEISPETVASAVRATEEAKQRRYRDTFAAHASRSNRRVGLVGALTPIGALAARMSR